MPTFAALELICIGNEGNHFTPLSDRVFLVSDCVHLSTARWLCASRTATTATQSATLAQIAVLTSGWEVTFGSEMSCTVRSTPKRGTKAQEVPLEPPCPLASESAAPHLPRSGRRVLLVCLKLHLIWLSYRPWDGAWRWTLVNDMARDVLFWSHLTILCNIMIHFLAFLIIVWELGLCFSYGPASTVSLGYS